MDSAGDEFSVEVGSVQPICDAGDGSLPNVNQFEDVRVSEDDLRTQSIHSLNSPRMRNLRSNGSRLNARPHSMAPLQSDKHLKAKRFSNKQRNSHQPRLRTSSTSAANQSETGVSDRNDMQSLLTDASRARSGQNAVSAHAERLRAAENRRLSRQVSNRWPPYHG